MGTRQRIIGTARLGAALVLAAGVTVLGQTGAGAASQPVPAPLGAVGGTVASLVPAPPPSDPTRPVTQVVGTVTGALGGSGRSGSAGGSQPGDGTSARTGAAPATSGSSPAASSPARAQATPAADDDTVVGADVTVRGLLGACVRLTSSGVPARATVVVLDQNLLDQLRAVGLPVERLVVPCPAGAAAGTSGGPNGGTDGSTNVGATSAAATGDPQLAGTDGLLAFTGADLAPTLLLAGGLIALGIAFLRKADALGDEVLVSARGV